MKSCPFCDGDILSPRLIGEPNSEGGFPVAIVCTTCHAQGPVVYETDMANDSPKELWDTRPTEERLSKMVLDAERRFRK